MTTIAKPTSGPSLRELLGQIAEQGQLAELLSLLSPAQNRIVTVRYVDNLGLSTAAQALGVSRGTIRYHLRVIRGRLLIAPTVEAYRTLAGELQWINRKWYLRRRGDGCAYCGTAAATTIDHVHPRSRGGTDDLGNLTLACEPCNADKGALTVDEWRAQRLASDLSWPPVWRTSTEVAR